MTRPNKLDASLHKPAAPVKRPGDDEQNDAVIGHAFRWSLAVIAVAAVATATGIWWRYQPEPPPEDQVTQTGGAQERKTPASGDAPAIPKMPFRDVTQAAGIDFVHVSGATGEKLFPETMTGGCAFLDYDADGDADILFINGRQWPWDVQAGEPTATLALYRNDGAGRFVDVTATAGLDFALYGMGVAVGDYDEDGFDDVYITALGPNRLFRNTGNGRFEDVTDEAGVAGAETDPHDWSSSTGFFDCDNDGDLDLFVCTYVKWEVNYDRNQPFKIAGVGRAYGQPQKFSGTYNRLYRNDGDGRFTDISASAGIQVDDKETKSPLGKSLGVTFADFNADGLLDVFVCNDTVRNFLFENQGGGKFKEVGRDRGVAFDTRGVARGAMGVDAGRFRNNADLGIAVGNFSSEMTALYVSRDGISFSDEAVANGIGPVTRQVLTFGLFFFDPDLDGRQDLFAANGHLEVDIEKGQSRQKYEQPPQLLWNVGKRFRTEFISAEAAHVGEDFLKRMVARGAAFADIDGDGDQDVLIVATGRKPRLLRNDQLLGNHWLRVRLIGTQGNRSAIGAWVEVHTGKTVRRQQVMPARSYQSSVESTLTFGLGKLAKIDQLLVTWPDGSSQQFTPETVDRELLFRQRDAKGLSVPR